MSVNNSDNLPTTNNNKRRNYHYYQQLGAPTLIYEGNRRDGSTFRVASKNLPTDNNGELYETFKRRNRVKARWQYGLDVDQIESVVVPYFVKRKRKHIVAKPKGFDKDSLKVNDNGSDDNDDTSICSGNSIDNNDEEKQGICGTRWMDHKQQQTRLAILLEDDPRISRHKECLENYAVYQYPYVEVELDRKRKSSVQQRKEPKIELVTYSKGQEFSINQKIDSDPSYLAPFDMESINEATSNGGSTFIKNIQIEPLERLPQGNALLCVPCPCHPCSKGTQGYVVLHPKGYYMERLCVSNVIPPIDKNNAGDIKNAMLKMIRKNTEFHWNAITSKPNEICLDDTILEIRQCGAWNVGNQQCIFAVRTGTHISVVEVMCNRPDLEEQQQYSFPSSSCWGCYVLEEKERLDFRSFSPKLPSFRPVALTSHPRYGNDLIPCKFAFVSHSVGGSASTTYNVVHSCTFGTERIAMNRHDIINLKSISFIDFSNRNPMCLWSAASSYIRPALAPGAISKMQRQTKSPFGLGSSLFAIDLRSNSATFQWSPSAEEMTTEGVHSINGILTDWTRNSTVFVTSTSAGKTYEIDGRMPCRAVNAWSLTSVCEESRNITLPPKSFYGEPSLLFKPIVQCNDVCRKSNNDPDSPLVKVDTDFRANGIHLFQKPLRKPRFQTESLECIGTSGLNATGTANIASSSYYDLTDVSNDTFTCGVSSIRLPLNQFVGTNDNIWAHYLEQKLKVLCTMTLNNNGDIYCHSLLECNDEVEVSGNCRRFDGLPIGTAAINIPNKLDGRTMFLKNGHWKPTGGMNLNFFLSNTYPVPRSAMISGWHEYVEGGVDKNSQMMLLNPCKKKRIDEGADVIQIGKGTRKPALTIISKDSNGCHNGMLQQDGKDRTLTMPLSLSQDVHKNTVVYEGRNDYDSDDTNGMIGIGRNGGDRKKSSDRTDLSKNVIENTLEGWEDTVSEPESSED